MSQSNRFSFSQELDYSIAPANRWPLRKNYMHMKSITAWRAIVAIAILLVLLSFGVVFRPATAEPFLLSLPYVLWSGILITALMVILTFVGTRVFPHKED
jgi:drug/metabolite transporter (DMT)-like permease